MQVQVSKSWKIVNQRKLLRPMSKPSLIYYEIQDFQKKTLDYIDQHFNVTTLQDPDQDTDEILKSAQVVFAPMGYIFDQNKIERCANLQVIATPTTGTVHIDAEYAKLKTKKPGGIRK